MSWRNYFRIHFSRPFLALSAAMLIMTAFVVDDTGRAGASASSRIHIPVAMTNLTGLRFTPVATGLGLITDIAHAGDERLFVAERDGRIRIVYPDGTVAPVPFLDLHTEVSTFDREQGLLGLAFHPDFARNGLFYVAYTPLSHPADAAPLVVSRFAVDLARPDIAIRSSKSDVLAVTSAGRTHQGGSLRFSPDGTLFIGIGDGSNAALAQDGRNLRGKVLRIDVGPHASAPYLIPPDNPFFSEPAIRPEIWAMGVRNPFRVALDPQSGVVIIADVGAARWEEINVAASGGRNYGWPCMEGPDPLSAGDACEPRSQFTAPTAVYDHRDQHCAVIGGDIYRGSRYPILDGHYFFADFCSGAVWSMAPPWTSARLMIPTQPIHWTAAGHDASGEIYFAGMTNLGGVVYHLIPGD